MKRELDNELEPLDVQKQDFWKKATLTLLHNPRKVLPAFLENPDAEPSMGDFFLRFVEEEGRTFLQAEGFSSNAMEISFLCSVSPNWQMLQPGIYRLNVTKHTRALR